MGANVMIVNNYRDMYDDLSVGKRTLAVILGRRAIATVYLFNGYIAVALMVDLWMRLPAWTWLIPTCYLIAHTLIWLQFTHRQGSRLTPLLGMTALAMLFYSILFLCACI